LLRVLWIACDCALLLRGWAYASNECLWFDVSRKWLKLPSLKSQHAWEDIEYPFAWGPPTGNDDNALLYPSIG
jgi:hypothetical protein